MKSVPGGRSAASVRLTLGESTAAVLVMARIEDVSYPPSRSAVSSGCANASPQIESWSTRSRTIVRHAPWPSRRRTSSGRMTVPPRWSVARVVAHLNQVLEQREVVPHRGQARREGRVIDDGARPAGGEHEAQLVGHVAVVDVDEGRARVERAEHRLEPLGAVVGVDGDVVVARFPGLEVRPLGAAAEAEAAERAPHPPRAPEELGEGEDPVAP